MGEDWLVFEPDQVRALGREARGRPDVLLRERTCPACGRAAVRHYAYSSARGEEPTVISYVWCPHCHRYQGSTGPGEPGLDVADLLTPEEHGGLAFPVGFFGRLDELWKEGNLPR